MSTATETQDTALDKYQVNSALAPDMAEVTALAQRIKKTVPGMDKLSDWHAVAAAQYALMTGANLVRGEMYAYEDKRGNLQMVEGYKLLVRWAKAKCDYSEWFEPYDTDKGIGFTCFVLRQDKIKLLDVLSRTMPDKALDIATTSSTGIVRHNEMGREPPTGWTWEQVAKKRALKNALNLAYGMPSPDELAAETWQVEDVTTIPKDWDEVREGAGKEEKKLTAKYNANRRAHLRAQATQTAEQVREEAAVAVEELFDFGADADQEPPADYGDVLNGDMDDLVPPDDGPVSHKWTAQEYADLIDWTRAKTIDDSDVLVALGVAKVSEFPGDFGEAQAQINQWITTDAQAEVPQ
jgi:hypothetical protein